MILGYCVDEATNSEEASILIKKDRYDVCLFDYTMKGLNGKDLLKMTKNINPKCLVFIVSGMVDTGELRSKKKNDGLADGIISKPFNVDTILKK